jgi:hypothetical protein
VSSANWLCHPLRPFLLPFTLFIYRWPSDYFIPLLRMLIALMGSWGMEISRFAYVYIMIMCADWKYSTYSNLQLQSSSKFSCCRQVDAGTKAKVHQSGR